MNIKHAFTITVIILIVLLGGIGYLLWGQPGVDPVVNPPIAAAPIDDEEPTPPIVTADTLAPKEIVRVWLQAWYQRDFMTQYFFLAPAARSAEPEAAFVKRMQALPALEGIRIANIQEKVIDDTHIDISLTIEPEVEGAREPFDITFGFVKSVDGWKVGEIPVLAKPGS